MTLVLLDTNAYLRLAKRIHPFLGTKFGDCDYIITILKDVEDEVHKSSKLRFHYPWFDDSKYKAERMAKQVRLSDKEKLDISNAQSILYNTALGDKRYLAEKRSPPGQVDCRVLAFTQIRQAIVVTDDLGIHLLANDFDLPIWHGYELLHNLRLAGVVTNELIVEIYEALENNRDITKTWKDAKHTIFADIFGNQPAKP